MILNHKKGVVKENAVQEMKGVRYKEGRAHLGLIK